MSIHRSIKAIKGMSDHVNICCDLVQLLIWGSLSLAESSARERALFF
uniref:Uncharacterized protein n=1 Tax=Anguilla anguilla TaxID=7936 RepID=A0A0E9QW62_ANGAN